METIRPKILIIGENIYSIFLSFLLKNTGIESIILSQNKSAMLFNPVMKYFDTNFRIYQALKSEKIKDFLKELSFLYLNNFSPIEALYNTGDIVKCSAIHKNYNYYEEAKKENTKIIFVNIENLQDTITPTIEENERCKLINIKIIKKEQIYSIYELASILDNDSEALKPLALELQNNIRENRDIIVLPPILGVFNSDKIRDFLINSLKNRVFEALTLNPIIISKRFFKLQKDFEVKNGIRVIYDNITKIQSEHNHIQFIITDNYEIHPELIVLISERFVEEGLTIEKNKVVEAIFNLPVFFTNKKNETTYFTEEDIFGSHNIFNCGIKTDNKFIPIDIFGNLVFKNLYAVGSIVINNPDILKNLDDTYKLFTIIKENIKR